MNPRIETRNETKLIGMKTKVSYANNKTMQLWQRFMPRRKEITTAVGIELYSLEVYNDTGFFRNFNPTTEFEKWAAVPVNDFDLIPEEMETLTIPKGAYAVFPYKGKPSEARETFQFIHTQWLPKSEYTLDNRPHFALMDEKYKGEDPESEEEFWIPVRKK